MMLIPYDRIDVDDGRQRTEIDADSLAELTASIQERGLMNPPTVTLNGDSRWKLIAGYRRLLSIKSIGGMGDTFRHGNAVVDPGLCPVVLFEDLTRLQREELELDENLKRVNLSWQEQAAATERLHALRTEQAATQGIVHTVAKTAEELTGRSDGQYQARTKQAIVVARYLGDADVAKAKSLDEATKIIAKKEERAQHERIAAVVGERYTAALHSLHQADCRTWMRDQPPGQFDCVITDPPYGMSADRFGDSGGRNDEVHSYNDDHLAFAEFLTNLGDITRLCKPAAHIYVFCDIDGFGQIRARLNQLGWSAFRTPLVMHKGNSGRVPLPEHGPRRQYELVCYAFKGGKPCTGVYPDVFTVQMPEDHFGHGAQKPIEAYTNLLLRSCRAGDRVFDPYAGTGTVFPAATGLKLYATGVERDPATFGLAAKRLEALK